MRTDRPFVPFISRAIDALVAALDDQPPGSERIFRLRDEKRRLERFVPRQLPHGRYDAQAQAWGIEGGR